jgi:hypothetical protein
MLYRVTVRNNREPFVRELDVEANAAAEAMECAKAELAKRFPPGMVFIACGCLPAQGALPDQPPLPGEKPRPAPVPPALPSRKWCVQYTYSGDGRTYFVEVDGRSADEAAQAAHGVLKDTGSGQALVRTVTMVQPASSLVRARELPRVPDVTQDAAPARRRRRAG